MTAYRNAVNYVADAMHDKWRDDRGHAPRWKEMDAESIAWLAKSPANANAVRITDKYVAEIDIAALTNSQLPPQFSGENNSAAEGAVSIVLDNPTMTTDEVATVVHSQWVERNASWAAAELQVPYDQLPDVEQEKDRVIVRLALEAVEKFGLLLIQSGR